MDSVEIVRKFYDETVNYEWNRLDRHQVEFELSKRFITRYIKPHDKVLDPGGGPGKYSLYLSKLGCEVTLADLSQNNVDFALNKAKELGLPLTALSADSGIYRHWKMNNMITCCAWVRCITSKMSAIG